MAKPFFTKEGPYPTSASVPHRRFKSASHPSSLRAPALLRSAIFALPTLRSAARARRWFLTPTIFSIATKNSAASRLISGASPTSPASAKPEQILAFDTGPANMLIDALVAHFTHDRQRYDKGAQLAMKGRDIVPLFSVLLKEPYLYEPPPKSTGREYFGKGYVDKFLQLGRKYRAKPNDLIHAATWFTLVSVRLAIELFVLPKTKVQQLIVSGGGANNPLIYSILSEFYGHNGIAVMKSSHFGIPIDAKEAFAFAILAYETLHGRPANLPSATGARGPAILGKISYAPPR
jgi:anhydro-N-acetylmuramic acid kinase